MLLPSSSYSADPSDFAIVDDTATLSWVDLDRIVPRVSASLLAAGLADDERVAVFAANAAEAIVAHLGAVRAGVSSVPVNAHLTAEELSYILRDSGARILFVGPETCDIGLRAAAQADVRRVVGWRCSRPEVVEWDRWLSEGAGIEPDLQMRPRPYLHYTSGTTGRPKGAESPPTLFPAVDTVEALLAKWTELGIGEPTGPTLVCGPLYHTGPLSSVRRLATGRPVVIMKKFGAEPVLAAIDRYRIESAVMVPTHFYRLLDLPESVKSRYDVSSMKMLIHTGSACPNEIKRRMIAWFGPILLEGYGGTEAGTTNAITTDEWLRHPGSVGKAQPPFELLIIGDDGQPMGPHQVGEIYFRDLTGRGIVYHNDPEKTKAAHLTPGVFTLGEVGYYDDEGYLYITDRVSDMVISGGVNIYPAEIEEVLASHPLVEDVAVIGVANAEMGESLLALVVWRGAETAAKILDPFCREKLAGYKCPRVYRVVTQLERSAMGKLDKRALRATYGTVEPADQVRGDSPNAMNSNALTAGTGGADDGSVRSSHPMSTQQH